MWFGFPLLFMENKWLQIFLLNSQWPFSSLPSSKLKDFSNFALSRHCPEVSTIHCSHLSHFSSPLRGSRFWLRTAWTTRQVTKREGEVKAMHVFQSYCVNLEWVPSGGSLKPPSETHLLGGIRLCFSPQEIRFPSDIFFIMLSSLLKTFQRLLAAPRIKFKPLQLGFQGPSPPVPSLFSGITSRSSAV